MNVKIVLNGSQGASLGPNFTLSSNGIPSTVSPGTATLTDLSSPGLDVTMSDSATTVTITSEGTCTNSLTLPIAP